MNGQTPRSRKTRRPDLDRAAVRYFVYTVRDAAGTAIYIGRSCDVPSRLRAHFATLGHPGLRPATWILDARSVGMVGPFTWDQAVKVEREQIELHQPRGNRDLTARDRRPAIAMRSAARRPS